MRKEKNKGEREGEIGRDRRTECDKKKKTNKQVTLTRFPKEKK